MVYVQREIRGVRSILPPWRFQIELYSGCQPWSQTTLPTETSYHPFIYIYIYILLHTIRALLLKGKQWSCNLTIILFWKLFLQIFACVFLNVWLPNILLLSFLFLENFHFVSSHGRPRPFYSHTAASPLLLQNAPRCCSLYPTSLQHRLGYCPSSFLLLPCFSI